MKYSLRSLMTFSIRDLFLVTLVVALAVAWWLDRSRLAQRAANAELEADGAKRILDLIDPDWGSRTLQELVNLVPDSSAPAPSPPKP
jgi:hypothetical protein